MKLLQNPSRPRKRGLPAVIALVRLTGFPADFKQPIALSKIRVILVLFDFNDSHHKYREVFDEFPDIENFDFRFTTCSCGSTRSFVISTVSRHKNFMPIVACADCGTLRANPYFTAETATHYYGKVYGKVKRAAMTPEKLFADQRQRSLAPMLGNLSEAFETVLDFGGGAGGKMFDLLEKGKTVFLHEVEDEYSQFAYTQGIQPYDKTQKYDLVVVSHVIEHMIDPSTQMADLIRDCCTENGLLFVATPIIDRQRARQWLQHFHIAHKYYFTHDSLIGLMAGLGCTLVTHNNADGFLFRVGGEPDQDFIAECYARGAQKTRSLVEAESKPTLKRLLQFLRNWRPVPNSSKGV